VLLHLIDAYSNDVGADYATIRKELADYSPELATRPEVVAVTKIEGLDADIVEMQLAAAREAAGHDKVTAISSSAGQGIKELLRILRTSVTEARQAEADLIAENDEHDGIERISLSSDDQSKAWSVTKLEDGSFEVQGQRIEKFARRTDFEGGYQNVNRLRDIMKKMGIAHELKRQGAEGDSVIRIGRDDFTFLEQ
jgi:GTP-binding protein